MDEVRAALNYKELMISVMRKVYLVIVNLLEADLNKGDLLLVIVTREK